MLLLSNAWSHLRISEEHRGFRWKLGFKYLTLYMLRFCSFVFLLTIFWPITCIVRSLWLSGLIQLARDPVGTGSYVFNSLSEPNGCEPVQNDPYKRWGVQFQSGTKGSYSEDTENALSDGIRASWSCSGAFHQAEDQPIQDGRQKV